MSEKNENDKTRVSGEHITASNDSQVNAGATSKPASGKAVPGQDSASDKTTVKTPGAKKRAPTQAEIEAHKLRLKKERLIAIKRAKLLAQAAQNKTVVAPKREKSSETIVKPPLRKDSESEKTQFKRPATPTSTQFAKPLSSSGEKTVFKAPAESQALDKTDISLPFSSGQPSEMPQKKEVLKGRFILEEVLGAGGMGVVYKAKDKLKIEAQDREPYVAIKVLGEEFKAHPEAFIALQRESRKTQKIAHPNIVNVHDFDKDGDTVFMTMEFLDGTPLDKLIKKYRATGLPPLDAWQILEGICAALSYAHDQSIIHSDLKPGNIFVTNLNLAKVFDFGIARAVASAEQSEAAAAEDRTIFDAGNLGALTPAYASMEMLQGETPDVRDDIYALGCIAYELFTGQHPFNKKNAKDAQEEGLKPKRIENITKHQWRIIEKSLAFSRDNRIESVNQFWSGLKAVHSKPVKAWAFAFVLLAMTAGYSYWEYIKPQPTQGPQYSEENIRSELELKLRLELVQKNLQALLDDPLFDERWEAALWEESQNFQTLLGADNPEVIELNAQILTLYKTQIEKEMSQEQFSSALAHAKSGLRYAADPTELTALIDSLEQKIAQQKIEQEKAQALAKIQEDKRQSAESTQKKAAQQKASQRNLFNLAMANVNEHLACKRMLDMNDFGIAINKMQGISQALYRKEEPRIINELASCIVKLSRNFPSRAESARQAALNIFNNHKTLANIQFETIDPCNTSKAGLGARGRRLSCDDVLASGGKGPELVVVPAGSGFSAFAIGKYEITNEDISQFCAATGACKPPSGDGAMPATGVSLRTAQLYTSWLSEQSGKEYRLPTAKEWRYAATGGRTAQDSNRNCFLSSRGIQKGGVAISANIGQQNGWGLVNHVGNVREWVSPTGGGSTAMGGSYNTPMEACVIDLSTAVESDGDAETGFRVLRELAPD